MANDRLSSGFASADAKGSGASVPENEVAVMLREDMTLEQARVFHLKRWGLTPEFSFDHDAAHILMALSKTLPGKPSDYPSQGDYEAEIYSVSIEMALLDSFSEKLPTDEAERKALFLKRVQENYDTYGPLGNLNRVVSWGLGRVAGIDGEQAQRENAYKDFVFYAFAQKYGIEVTEDQETWGVDIPALDERFWYVDERKHYFPDDIEGVDDFKKFKRPTDAEAGQIYERIKPGLNMLTDFIDEDYVNMGPSQMGTLKVRDLHEAMVAGFTPPAPERDADGTEFRL